MNPSRFLGISCLAASLLTGCSGGNASESPNTSSPAKTDTAGLESTGTLVITPASLTRATEGVTYRKAPGTPEVITTEGGVAPVSLSATGLPAGLTLDAATGALEGIPAPGSAGTYTVDVEATDANSEVAQASFSLEVVAPQPLRSTGTVGVEPEGSPLTDALTVFVLGEDGLPRQNVGVRVRKNGVEYSPAVEALTDAQGRVSFSGLGLDGVTDTVDVTANGSGLGNITLAQVNASLVTLVAPSYPLPLPRSNASAAWDTQAGRFLVTAGRGAGGSQPSGCLNDTVALVSPGTASWEEWVAPGLSAPSAPSARVNAAFAYKGSGVSVLFGGETCSGSKLSDTWQLNSTTHTWAQSGAPGPSARSGAALVSSPVSGGVYLFGGNTGTGSTLTVNNELWSFVGGWGKLTPTGTLPTARAFAAAALDTSSSLIWMCGGATSAPFGADQSSCSTYNRTTNAWAGAPAMPVARRAHTMAYRPGDGLYVFGGTSNSAARNDLIRWRNGLWSTMTANGAAGSPPGGAGTQLAYDPGSGNLVLFAGTGTVWTFNGTAWSKQVPADAPKTVTLSGSITGGASSGGATVWVVGPNGFSTTTRYVSLPGGSGSYALAGLPSGVPLSVYAYYESGGLYSHKDVGTVGPLSADTTLNIALEPGPLAFTTTSGTLVTPSDWTTINSRFAQAVRFQPGLPAQPNGPVQTGVSTTFSADYLPATAPATQGVQLEVATRAVALCETLTAWVYGPAAGDVGTVAMPGGVRDVSPGVSECGTSTPPVAPEGSYQFTAPLGTELVTALRGVKDMAWDWKYIGRAQAGAQSLAFPLPSTLAPSRPSPSGQTAAWEVTATVFAPGSGFSYEQFESAALRPAGTARAQSRAFVRQ